MATIAAFNMGRLTGVHRRGSIEYRVLAGLLLQFTESTGFQRIPVEWAGDPDVRNREGYYHAAISLYTKGLRVTVLLGTTDGQSFLSDKIRITQRGESWKKSLTFLCTHAPVYMSAPTIARLWKQNTKSWDQSSVDTLASMPYRLADGQLWTDRMPRIATQKHMKVAWHVIDSVLRDYPVMNHSLYRFLNT
jgi:hypothetical protein